MGLPTNGLRRGAEGLPIFWGGAEAFTESEKAELLSERVTSTRADDVMGCAKPIRERFEEKAWENRI